MLIALFGDNCVGKTTIANKLKEEVAAEVIVGKDYLKIAKSESEATLLFKKKLLESADGKENVIYVISERSQLEFLPENTKRILITASLNTIKERFRNRMRGTLPKPVEEMLERKYGQFESFPYELRIDTETTSIETSLEKIFSVIKA